MNSLYQFHREETVDGTVGPETMFAFLDDHKRLAAHMEKPSLMMAGATMKIETDELRGQVVGSQIRLKGQVLGIALSVVETVIDYAPPLRKTWETSAEPKLLVIGRYRMGFELTPQTDRTRLRVWIDYDLPSGVWTRWLGKLLGNVYAKWCINQMISASSTFTKLDPAVERRRRRSILLNTVPRLLDQELKSALGWWRFLFMARLFLLAPFYRKRFMGANDDMPVRAVKKTFLLVGVLYHELVKRFGEARALAITQAFLYRLACAVQHLAYFPPAGEQRNWDHFHRAHEAQMEEGFIRHNENDGVIHTDKTVTMHITRCRFHECFRDMGNAAITEAFCRSDETVFNEYSPLMRFHRDVQVPDTIARGASRCTFIFERLRSESTETEPRLKITKM